MKSKIKPIALLLCLALLTSACGGGIWNNLRTALALAPPLIDSLVTAGVVKPELRATYIRDFEDLISGVSVLKENLDSCDTKSCKLDAVDKYQQLFFEVANRGNFGKVEKLRKVQIILQGIIEAARIYYSPQVVRRDGSTEPQTDAEIKAGIEKLREAMKP